MLYVGYPYTVYYDMVSKHQIFAPEMEGQFFIVDSNINPTMQLSTITHN